MRTRAIDSPERPWAPARARSSAGAPLRRAVSGASTRRRQGPRGRRFGGFGARFACGRISLRAGSACVFVQHRLLVHGFRVARVEIGHRPRLEFRLAA
jgi:hypothetical protein